MKYLKKLWIRILLSLFSGGILAEFVHIRLGSLSPQTSSFLVWIGAGIVFSILSLVVWAEKYRYYFFQKKDNKEEILDDLD